MALVRIYIGRGAMDAHHVRSLLNGEGIDAEVMGGMLGMAWPLVAPTLNTHPTVLVHDKDVTRALGVLRDLKMNTDTELEDWVCPSCGETVEGQFSACWSCGAAQPSAETA